METTTINELDKIENARAVLQGIAKGIDPLTGELISENTFLQDSRIIRCFYFITEILDNVSNGSYNRNNNLPNFIITPEQKSRVVMSEGRIGVNEFSKCINTCIDTNISKKLTGVELNKRLKKLGILSETSTSDGKTRTITNENSFEFGFEMETRSFKGAEYEMVCMNDKGKKYLMDNIEGIMSRGA